MALVSTPSLAGLHRLGTNCSGLSKPVRIQNLLQTLDEIIQESGAVLFFSLPAQPVSLLAVALKALPAASTGCFSSLSQRYTVLIGSL